MINLLYNVDCTPKLDKTCSSSWWERYSLREGKRTRLEKSLDFHKRTQTPENQAIAQRRQYARTTDMQLGDCLRASLHFINDYETNLSLENDLFFSFSSFVSHSFLHQCIDQIKIFHFLCTPLKVFNKLQCVFS